MKQAKNLKGLLYRKLDKLRLEVDSGSTIVDEIKMVVDSLIEFYEEPTDLEAAWQINSHTADADKNIHTDYMLKEDFMRVAQYL